MRNLTLTVIERYLFWPLEGAQGPCNGPIERLDLYLLPGSAAVRQRNAFVDQALVGAQVLIEDLPNRQAALKHLHLFLLLERHLEPLLGSQDLLLQGRLEFLRAEERKYKILHLFIFNPSETKYLY